MLGSVWPEVTMAVNRVGILRAPDWSMDDCVSGMSHRNGLLETGEEGTMY